MSPKLDLINKRFGDLTVVSFYGLIDNRTHWSCVCSCGKTTIVKGKYLTNGDTKSCGCRKQKLFEEDILSTVYTNLTPVKRIVSNWKSFYECNCVCGNIVNVSAHNLISGNTKSCGCLTRHTEKELVGTTFGYLTVVELLKAPKDKKTCKCLCSCGNTHYVPATDLVSGNTKSCGCLIKDKMKAYWAAKTRNKDFILRLRIKISNDLRSLILKRDNYQCQICHKQNQSFEMHHIIPIKDCPTEESILNEQNCITLCRQCHHKKAHGKSTQYIDSNIQKQLANITGLILPD